MMSLWAVAIQLHNYAGPIVMLAYPLYASVSAIESPSKEDDTQWLTYWVLYSFVQLIELGFDRILVWIPFWYTLKLAVISWLVLPQFHGAAFVYNNYVKTYVGAGGDSYASTQKLSPRQRQLIDRISPKARASVSAYLDKYGSAAFDDVITSISEANRKSRSPPSAARPRRSPTAAVPTSYSGSPPSHDKSSDDAGDRKSDSFREYCRQPAKLLKTGLHSLEKRRKGIRQKMRTNFVA